MIELPSPTVLLLGLLLSTFPASASTLQAAPDAGLLSTEAASDPAMAGLGAPGGSPLDIGFVPNGGQWPPEVLYRLSGERTSLLLLADGLVELPQDAQAPAWRLRFDEAYRPALQPGAVLPGHLSYMLGNDHGHWASRLPHYASLTWQSPGTGPSLHLAKRFGALQLQIDTAAGQASPPLASPPWSWERLDRSDPTGEPRHASPIVADSALARIFERAWDSAGHRPIDLMQPDLGYSHPATSPRSLDQSVAQLAWSSYLGGSGSELARGLAVDGAGNAYVAGSTTSANLPTQNPLQPGLGNGGSLQDAFVAKISPDGQRLVWATYFGGNRQDEALDIAIDVEGRAHLTGYTTSPDFPMEKNFQDRVNLSDGIFSGDAFATKLGVDGGTIEFSTPLGGTARDLGKGIAVDPEGFVYVTGWTGSNFPGVNALYPLNRGVVDAFVVKIHPAGDDVVYSTHLGGSAEDVARDIAVDAAGNAYIVGTTQSVNFRVSEALQRANAGGRDAFIAKLSTDGQAVTWATYLGGRGDDFGTGIALGPDGSVTVVGRSDAPNFPRVDPFQRSRSGASDLFVSRLSPEGDALLYSSYLGGSAIEGDCAAVDAPRIPSTPTPAPGTPRLPEGSKFPDGPLASVAVDGAGRTYVSTCTSSSNAPLARPLQSSRSGRFAAYLAVLDPSGATLELGSYLGGQGLDLPRAVAVGADGGIYLAGQTTSTDFPTAPGSPLQASRAGTDDAFALKIGPIFEAPTATPLPPTVTSEPSPTRLATETPAASETPLPSSTPSPNPSATPSPSETPAPMALWLPWLGLSAEP